MKSTVIARRARHRASAFISSVKWPAPLACRSRSSLVAPSSPRPAARALPPLPPVSLASSSQAGAPWRCARVKPTATLTTRSSTAAASSEWRRTSRGRPGAVSGQRRPNERAERLLRPPLGSILPPKVALPRRRRRGRRSGFWESSVCRGRAPAGSLARGIRYVVPSNLCSFLFGISF